jgi:hypothetical protein
MVRLHQRDNVSLEASPSVAHALRVTPATEVTRNNNLSLFN